MLPVRPFLVTFLLAVSLGGAPGCGPGEEGSEDASAQQGEELGDAGPAVVAGAFSATYFDDANLTTPRLRRVEPVLGHDWGTGSPDRRIAPTTFSARWVGDWGFADRNYAFTLAADDGARLFIDDVLVIDRWAGPAGKTTVVRTMKAGSHRLRVEYVQQRGTASVSFGWEVTDAPATDGPATPEPAPTPTPTDPAGGGSTDVSYAGSAENFPNPERGYFPAFDPPWPERVTWSFCEQDPNRYTWTAWTAPLSAATLGTYKARGMSVAQVRYHLSEFRFKPLSQAFLDRLSADFATARQAGFKVVPHFTYNWPMGGPDAPLDQVLTHVEQLRPVLVANVDTLSYMNLGLIGCWGEMHNSAFGLIDPMRLNAASRAIINKVFDVLPKERMVVFRYPNYKFQFFGAPPENPAPIAPLTAAEAFTGTQKARWGQEEDCLVCGEWNYGTYVTPRNNAAEIKAFLNQDNKYVVQSGEPGDTDSYNPTNTDEDGDGYSTGTYNSCARMLRDLPYMRWSTLSATYNLGSPKSYDRWKAEGCYDTIAKRLGYRFRLTTARLPQRVAPGTTFSMGFTVVNEGFAAPYNRRLLELVLRHKQTGARLRLTLPNDPRRWLPDQTAGHPVTVSAGLPENTPVGEYDVLLSLPDPAPRLYERPEYSIRLANANTWEPTTGYNSLLRSVVVDPAAGGTPYTGPLVFR